MIHGGWTNYSSKKCRCAECTTAWSEYSAQYRLANKEKLDAWHKQNYQNNREEILGKQKDYALRNRTKIMARKYGVSVEVMTAFEASDDGHCAICGDAFRFVKKFSTKIVDHNHETGELRGFICGSCNIGLGFYEKLRRNNLVAKVDTYLEPGNLQKLLAANCDFIPKRHKLVEYR